MNNVKAKKKQVRELLSLHYGFPSFRRGQEDAIECVLSGRDALVIMPTGGGKSLCYQLPALVMEGATIVVSPLIALMKDQVDSLEKIGIPASFINSSITQAEAQKRMEAAKRGELKLLYIAPERFYNQEFLEDFAEVQVSLLAVDEAHCISEWGHDFRPSYLKIGYWAKKFGRPPIMALTATATPEVREDIIKQLDLSDRQEIITGFARPSLQFGVIRAKESEKLNYLLESIRAFPHGSGVVYAGTRAKSDEIANFLLSKNIQAVVYHAGMQGEDRQWVQDAFMKNRVKVIVATNAFGLGIDKKDIRFVIHYDMPGTIEAYYQEAGRAGRDGKSSFCLLFYNPKDRYLREFFIKGDNPAPETILRLYELLKSYEADKVLVTYAELKEALGLDAPDMAIGTSLKILENAGLVGRSREKNGQGYIRFISDIEKIRQSLPKRSKVQKEILEKLAEKKISALYQGIEFNSEELADSIGVKRDSLMRLVNKLRGEGAIEYSPPFKGSEISILKRVPAADLDFEALEKKLKNSYAKLDKMEEYIHHNYCRQKYILHYFGEPLAENCAKCDNCLNGFKKREYPFGKSRKFLPGSGSKTDMTVDKKHYFSSGITTKLTQLKTLELYKQGLGLEEIARERSLTASTIIAHICYLIEKGADVEISDFIKKEKIKKISKSLEGLKDVKLKPLKEALNDDELGYDDIKLALSYLKSRGK